MQDTVTQMNALCDEQPFNTHWYLKDLITEEEAHRDGDVIVPSGSTRKIAVLMTALKKVNDGEVSLDDPFIIEEQYQKSPSGCFTHLTTGLQITFYDALVMMIIVSDNACTGKICEIIGLNAINDFCQSIGMSGTTHRTGWGSGWSAGLEWDHSVDVTNATTANDLGLLLNHMVDGMNDAEVAAKLGSTPELCSLAMDIMSWQKMRNQLPLLLPPGSKVAHKGGIGVRNHNDAGVVYADGKPRFTMVIMTDQVRPVMPDGLPGQGTAYIHSARVCRTAWDGIVG
jgi:beta-lactamase class A